MLKREREREGGRKKRCRKRILNELQSKINPKEGVVGIEIFVSSQMCYLYLKI